MSEAMLDRLALTPARIEDMAKGVEDVPPNATLWAVF